MLEKIIRIISIDPGKATGIASAEYTLMPDDIAINLDGTYFIEAGDYKDVGTLERHLYQVLEVLPSLASFMDVHLFENREPHELIIPNYLVIESPFAMSSNLNSVLTQQGYLSALAILLLQNNHTVEIDRFMLIKPAMIKKLATANNEHPFTSGNGLSEKSHLAEAVAAKFSLTNVQLATLLQKPHSRAKKPVYEITDALAIGYSAARILQAAYFDLDQDIPKRKNTKAIRDKIAEWRNGI